MYPIATLVALSGAVFFSKVRQSRSAGFVFCLAWLFVLLSLFAIEGLVEFEVSGSAYLDIFLSAAIGAYVLGYAFLPSRRLQIARKISVHQFHLLVRVTTWTAIGGILASIGMLLFRLTSGVSLFDIETARTDAFESLGGGARLSAVLLVSAQLSPLSVLSVILYPYIRNSSPSGLQVPTALGRLVAVSAASMVASGILVFGGRMNLAIVALGYWLSRFLSMQTRRRESSLFVTIKRLVPIVLGVWVAGWLATGFLALRHSDLDDPVRTARLLMRMEPKQALHSIVRDSPTAGLLLVSSGYLTSPIPSLDYYLQQGEIPGPYLGGYNFPLVARNMHRIAGNSEAFSWLDIRDDVFRPFVDGGYLGNVWATLLRDLAVDFSVMGAIIFMLLLGWVTRWTQARGQEGRAFAHLIGVLLTLVAVFSPFVSLFPSVYISNTIVYALALWFVTKIRIRNGSVASDAK